jgi:hypothetical protein
MKFAPSSSPMAQGNEGRFNGGGKLRGCKETPRVWRTPIARSIAWAAVSCPPSDQRQATPRLQPRRRLARSIKALARRCTP